jgi:hypothetical protein
VTDQLKVGLVEPAQVDEANKLPVNVIGCPGQTDVAEALMLNV